MKLITELRKNKGEFEYEDFAEDVYAYECALKSILKRKDYELAYNMLKCYIEQYKQIIRHGICSYRPGMDYICSCYFFLKYAEMMENGIKGVAEKNTDESIASYLEVLKRYPRLSDSIKRAVFHKRNLLVKYAYPDLNDLYSDALTAVGEELYAKKKYKEAFRFFKKGADFEISDRQICYPYYLIAINQDRVADMYRDGIGVKKNAQLARKYYHKCAENCGRERSPKVGDFYLEKGDFAKAFIYYTETNNHFPNYYLGFLIPDDLDEKFNAIFLGIKEKPDSDKTKLDLTVLAMMYYGGFGCEQSEEKFNELLPNGAEWAKMRVEEFYYFINGESL